MHKVLLAGLMGLAITTGLSGCVLAPQTIALSDEVSTVPAGQPAVSRDALVRVRDERSLAPDVLGNRGGRLPENSPLLSDRPLTDVLSARLQASLKQLGFGSSSPVEPVKVQLDIDEFSYQCNEGVVVNECSVRMGFMLTVVNEGKTFTKPYSVYETRSLAASPVAEYNQQWVNEVLDRLWSHIFNDQELFEALQVRVSN